MRYIIFTLLVLFILSCKSGNLKRYHSTKSSEIKYAQNIDIFNKEGLILIHIKNPDTHAIEKKYVIVKKTGTKIPADYTLLKTPVKSIVALSGTHIGMLDVLNMESLIRGISNHLYIHNKFVRNSFDAGKIIEVGEEGKIPIELLISSKSQVLMYSGFGKKIQHEKMLEKIGMKCIVNYDWRETHPLGKAEWIKLFGYLTGKEKEASNYFLKIVRSYDSLKKIAKTSISKPTLYSGNLIGDIWYSPAGENYNAILFNDANCNYVYRNTKGTGSVQKSFEQILFDNKRTSFWVNPGSTSIKQLLLQNPKYKYFEAVIKKKVYCYSQSGNKFWERSCVEPHHVLADLIQILHPELASKKELYFYNRLN